MRTPAIDEPLRLGAAFGVLYAALAVPSLWILRPWTWPGPGVSIVAGFVLPPFLVGIAIYASVFFMVSVTANFRVQRRALAEFLAAIVAPCALLLITWFYSGYRHLPATAGFVTSFTAYSALYRLRSNRRPPS